MATKKTFDFKLEDKVSLLSGETGVVVARSHSIESNPQYLVRYVAGDGRQVEAWWTESAIRKS